MKERYHQSRRPKNSRQILNIFCLLFWFPTLLAVKRSRQDQICRLKSTCFLGESQRDGGLLWRSTSSTDMNEVGGWHRAGCRWLSCARVESQTCLFVLATHQHSTCLCDFQFPDLKRLPGLLYISYPHTRSPHGRDGNSGHVSDWSKNCTMQSISLTAATYAQH